MDTRFSRIEDSIEQIKEITTETRVDVKLLNNVIFNGNGNGLQKKVLFLYSRQRADDVRMDTYKKIFIVLQRSLKYIVLAVAYLVGAIWGSSVMLDIIAKWN